MKVKVSILTAIVLCVILFALDAFIYITLYRHLLSLQANLLTSKVQTIAQSLYHLDLGTWFGLPGDQLVLYARLHSYSQAGQSILVTDPSGKLLAKVGQLPPSSVWTAIQLSGLQHAQVVDSQQGWYMFTGWPVFDQIGDLVGVVFLVESVKDVQDNLNTLLTALVLGSIGAVLLAAAGGYAISSAAVRPIDQMIRLVSRIQADHLNERLPTPKGKDEVSRLAQTFNQMLNRIEASFEQQARFVADVSHEIRTPLTTIQGYAELLGRWGKQDPEVVDKAIQVIRKEAVRLRNLTNDMLTLADLESSSKGLPKRADAVRLVNEVVEPYTLLHPEHRIEVDAPSSCWVAMPPEHLRRVLTNLVDNAIKYTPEGGEIRITISKQQGHANIAVTDTGQGIPEEDLPHIFERFYRVDKARSRAAGGNGLGLAIVKELIEYHGGKIQASSRVGQGTTMQFTLPVTSPNPDFQDDFKDAGP
ncbi:MAG: HAMP domain-containing protein [Alicyclobacillus sp.]|nr:HAMP domain-containing protein [Alicyclobacillus sp.]